MLFQRRFLKGIRDGTVTLAFRRWSRPTIREGGTLMTAVGQLQIGSVRTVALKSITAAEARKAGYDSRKELVAELEKRKSGEIYRVELESLRADPRIELRNSRPAKEELEELREKLRRLDVRATDGEWTYEVLERLRENPGIRAGDLCQHVGQERDAFKRNVRKLKNLGLTESLGTGYRLSPRGAALLQHLEQTGR